MGKRVKQTIKEKFDFKGGEIFNRMSYLFRIGNEVYQHNNLLSKVYIFMMKDISKRNALKIDKKMKRVICSQCNNLLYKDSLTNIKLINKSGKHAAHLTCYQCKTVSEIILF